MGGRAGAVDWPLARLDSHGSGAVEQNLPEQLEILWTYQGTAGSGFDATAVAADGIAYLGDSEGVFHAVRVADGSVVWTKTFAGASFGSSGAIDTENGRLFVGDLEGVVRCLALDDGREIWKAELAGEVYAGPMLFEDSVLVTSEAGTLACYDGSNGEERWRFEIDAPLRCTPTVAEGLVMLAGCDSRLRFIDVRSGQEIGSIEIDGPTGCTASVGEGRAFFGTEGGTFHAINISGAARDEASIAWTYRDPRRGQAIRAAAALSEDTVVYGSQGRSVYGLDRASGKEKWKLATRARVESSPVIAGRCVVAATTGGGVYLLDLGDGHELWKFEAGGNFTASPIVVDGKIILGNGDGTLYCFGAQGRPSQAGIGAAQ